MRTWSQVKAEYLRVRALARKLEARRNAPDFTFECGCRWKDTGRPCPLDEGARLWVCEEHGEMLPPVSLTREEAGADA